MKRIIVSCMIFISFTTCLYAYERSKNLSYLIDDHRNLRVFLGDITSETDKISADIFKDSIRQFLEGRKKETYTIVANKEDSDIIINAVLLSYHYSVKDPIDQVVGGTTGLIVDAFVDQNYAKVIVKFSVYRTNIMKKLWEREESVSVTQSNMSESDSIPKVLTEASKRFVVLCFGKRNKR